MPTQDPAAAIFAAMEGTMRRMNDIRAQMKADFKYEFHNRAIEPWADAVLINGSRKKLIHRVEDNLELAKMAKYIHTHNEVRLLA